MKAWPCPVCHRLNDSEQEICMCGHAHRDEKPIQYKADPRDRIGVDMTWAVLVGIVACVLIALGLAN